jgi:hypothetical protein
MSRYYIVVGIEAADCSRDMAARLVTEMLCRTEMEARVTAGEAVALTADDLDTILFASRSYVDRNEEHYRQLKAKLQQVREAVDRVVAARKERP